MYAIRPEAQDRMIGAVCFDLDGTLIDSTDAIVTCFFHTFDTLGLPRPRRKAIITTIGFTLEDQFGTMTDHDAQECTRIYRRRYEEVCLDMTTLMPGGREALEVLRCAGLPLGFATSKRRYFAEKILRHLGVLDYFAARVGPEDVAHPKPHPEALYKAAAALKVRPDAMVLIGDTHFDVLAARNAGMRCVCVTTGYNTREELIALEPTAVLDTLEEAAECLLRLPRTAQVLEHRKAP